MIPQCCHGVAEVIPHNAGANVRMSWPVTSLFCIHGKKHTLMIVQLFWGGGGGLLFVQVFLYCCLFRQQIYFCVQIRFFKEGALINLRWGVIIEGGGHKICDDCLSLDGQLDPSCGKCTVWHLRHFTVFNKRLRKMLLFALSGESRCFTIFHAFLTAWGRCPINVYGRGGRLH